MASTSTNVQDQTPPEITVYSLGQPFPSSILPRKFVDVVLATARQNFNNIVPTTYEASKAYLDEENLKPEGERDLRREICIIIALAIPDNQEVVLKLDAVNLNILLHDGSMVGYPTVDLPPTAFGTPGNDYCDKLVDRKTGRRGQASIMLVYFSRTGDSYDSVDIFETTKLDYSPFR